MIYLLILLTATTPQEINTKSYKKVTNFLICIQKNNKEYHLNTICRNSNKKEKSFDLNNLLSIEEIYIKIVQFTLVENVLNVPDKKKREENRAINRNYNFKLIIVDRPRHYIK